MRLIGETYGIRNLRDSALSAFQQVGGLTQAQVADEVARGESCHFFHLAVQMGPAEPHFLGKHLHTELRVVQIGIDHFHNPFHQRIIISLKLYGNHLLFLGLVS